MLHREQEKAENKVGRWCTPSLASWPARLYVYVQNSGGGGRAVAAPQARTHARTHYCRTGSQRLTRGLSMSICHPPGVSKITTSYHTHTHTHLYTSKGAMIRRGAHHHHTRLFCTAVASERQRQRATHPSTHPPLSPPTYLPAYLPTCLPAVGEPDPRGSAGVGEGAGGAGAGAARDRPPRPRPQGAYPREGALRRPDPQGGSVSLTSLMTV